MVTYRTPWPPTKIFWKFMEKTVLIRIATLEVQSDVFNVNFVLQQYLQPFESLRFSVSGCQKLVLSDRFSVSGCPRNQFCLTDFSIRLSETSSVRQISDYILSTSLTNCYNNSLQNKKSYVGRFVKINITTVTCSCCFYANNVVSLICKNISGIGIRKFIL